MRIWSIALTFFNAFSKILSLLFKLSLFPGLRPYHCKEWYFLQNKAWRKKKSFFITYRSSPAGFWFYFHECESWNLGKLCPVEINNKNTGFQRGNRWLPVHRDAYIKPKKTQKTYECKQRYENRNKNTVSYYVYTCDHVCIYIPLYISSMYANIFRYLSVSLEKKKHMHISIYVYIMDIKYYVHILIWW